MPMRFTLAGRQLHADRTPGGGPDPRRVVFVHGALNDRSVWTHAARWCQAQGLGVMVPDLPGHGLSEGPPDADISAMANTLTALLRATGPGPIVLVGHSMGSLVALESAARLARPTPDPQDPEIVDLVLVGTAFPMRVAPVMLQQAAETPLQAIELIASLSHAGAQDGRAERQALSRARMQRVLAGSDASRLPEGRRSLLELDLAACDRYDAALAAAHRLAQSARAPRCHLICGELDQMTPVRRTTLLVDALQAGRQTLPQAGHSMMEDDPEGFVAALQAVLQAQATPRPVRPPPVGAPSSGGAG
ncbi:MAG: hypothetical protein RL654_1350 [Pseudomonadota bacterium]|jgi:pimeloyl-ACP methyl ester carboxylesterase